MLCTYCCVWDHMGEFIFSWVHYWVSLRLLWGSQTARLGKDRAVPEPESGFLPMLWRRAVEHTCLHTHHLSHTQRACRMGSLYCYGAMSLCWQHFSPSKTKSNTTPAAPSVCLGGQEKGQDSRVRENHSILIRFTSNHLLHLCQNGSCD